MLERTKESFFALLHNRLSWTELMFDDCEDGIWGELNTVQAPHPQAPPLAIIKCILQIELQRRNVISFVPLTETNQKILDMPHFSMSL